jgi:pyruvate formate lyase activating enzyme
MSEEEVVEAVLGDRVFYESSQGGVTISGGEPLRQAAFAAAVLARCKKAGLHTALDTAAVGRWEQLALLLPYTDLVLLDIKHVHDDKHRQATGADCRAILANMERLLQTDTEVCIRVPVIPGFNDSEKDMSLIAETVRRLMPPSRQGANGEPRVAFELLRFHRLAADKYSALGMRYRAAQLEAPPEEKLETLRRVVASYGFQVLS